MRCDNCKKVFVAGNRADGLPNGIGYEMIDGTLITLCADCIMELGKLGDKGTDKFIKKVYKKAREKNHEA